MSNPLGALPTPLQAGDSWSWAEAAPDYPGPDWVLSYVLLSDSARVPLAAVWDAEAELHQFAASAAASALIAPDSYTWAELVRHTDGRRHTLGTGAVTVLPDPATVEPAGARSHARRMLAAIDACLEGRATEGDLDLVSTAAGSAGGNRASAWDPAQLIATRRYYAALVASEDDIDDRAAGIQRGFYQAIFR